IPTDTAATKSLSALRRRPRSRASQAIASWRATQAPVMEAQLAPVGLDHVAIDLDGALAELGEIDDDKQAAADEALDFLGEPGWPPARRLALGARVGRSRQHAVFGRDPSLPLAFEKRRNGLLHACGADDLG